MSKSHSRDDTVDTDDQNEVDTAELPQLDLADIADIAADLDEAVDLEESGLGEVASDEADSVAEPGSPASVWINDMEAEIERLRTRWTDVDQALTESEQRVMELQHRVDERDAVSESLRKELQTTRGSIAKLESKVADRDQNIAGLTEKLEEQATAREADADATRALHAKIDELNSQIKEREGKNSELTRQIQSNLDKIAALEGDAGKRNKAMTALQGRAQELESYVEGRRAHWLEQDAKIEEYRQSLEEMTLVSKSQSVQLEVKEKEKAALNARLLEFEKNLAQSDGRLKERDDAFREYQSSLQEQMGLVETLKADLASRARELQTVQKEMSEYRANIETRETELERRGTEIEQLTARLAEQDQLVAESSANSEQLTETVSELQAELSGREESIQELKDELDQAQQSVSKSEAEAAEAEARRSELADENAEHLGAIEELRNELIQAARERDDKKDSLEKANEIIRSLKDKLEHTENRVESYETENTSMRDQVNSLRSELKRKQAMIDAFDRSAQRLHDLKQSMQRVSSDDGASRDAALIIEAAHRFENHGSDAKSAHEPGEIRRMIVLSSGGTNTFHALTKDQMTIGRSNNCDICIRDKTVSRTHAQLTLGESGMDIVDAGSTNGLLVNSERVAKATLHHGDTISLGGRYDLKYVEVPPAPETELK